MRHIEELKTQTVERAFASVNLLANKLREKYQLDQIVFIHGFIDSADLFPIRNFR